jgi:predicted nucleic acid-binding protein
MGPDEPAVVVVCDAGPLIHLDELGCMPLLSDFGEIRVPGAVWQEVKRHRPSALRRRTVPLKRVENIPNPEPELSVLVRALRLHAGEIEALCLMQGVRSGILLTDDEAARFAAGTLGYDVHGTLGILLRALRNGRKTKRQVLYLLRAIPRRSTLFIRANLLNSVIQQVRQDR